MDVSTGVMDCQGHGWISNIQATLQEPTVPPLPSKKARYTTGYRQKSKYIRCDESDIVQDVYLPASFTHRSSSLTESILTHFFAFQPHSTSLNIRKMCKVYKNTYQCGHQLGHKWYDPADPKDCSDARRANRKHERTRKLLHYKRP